MGKLQNYTWICDLCGHSEETSKDQLPSLWSEACLQMRTSIWDDKGFFNLCDECSIDTLKAESAVYLFCKKCRPMQLPEERKASSIENFKLLTTKPLALTGNESVLYVTGSFYTWVCFSLKAYITLTKNFFLNIYNKMPWRKHDSEHH